MYLILFHKSCILVTVLNFCYLLLHYLKNCYYTKCLALDDDGDRDLDLVLDFDLDLDLDLDLADLPLLTDLDLERCLREYLL